MQNAKEAPLSQNKDYNVIYNTYDNILSELMLLSTDKHKQCLSN